ncbi:MAG: glycosyltransferase family 39 protein [Anaerolineae bacterium]|nr:glycosyltransferase family 39 protein [Anaerolineae bacterium]MBL8105156.1 glycosyltransferase family 39 protein [Anaerolineales bacterium]MCC7188294.1 glycosyltransferase family 39 protein [Anaerolineales bacterium]
MKQKKPITREEWGTLILILACAIGAYMRFNPTLLAGFAINDGGMFAAMVDDLRANRFVLAAFTTYNHLNIPYAYPPLGFYFGAITSLVFGLDSTQVVRWLPAFFATLSIPAFYFLALQLLKNKFHAAVSTFFFALMPRALSWFVMGGGLTRSPGQFFMLLTLAVVIRLYEQNRRSDIFLAGIFGGLAVMSHPEAAVHTLVSAVFLWLMLSRTRKAFIQSILVGLVVAVVSAPWWASVISYHGVAPLLSGAATGSKFAAVFNLLFFVFTEEPYATVIAVLGLIGIAHRLIRRDYLLPLWMAIPFFIEGRSAAGPAAIPLAMLAALGLVEVILPAIQPVPSKETEVSSTERNVFIYLILYLIFSTAQFGLQLSTATLYPPDEEAMRWARENTPDDSRFLVLTGTTSASCDSVMEWFPAISGRKSLFTVQGTEWTKGAGFNDYVRSTYAVQECLANSDMACLDELVDRADYDYLYVSKILRVNNCGPLAPQRVFPYFVESLKLDSGFDVVYESDGVLISRRK